MNEEKIKVFEFFSGIGTGHEALIENNISFESVGYSEIEPYAISVFNHLYGSKNYGDIKNINPFDLPDFNLLIAGFPCQDVSRAGQMKGINFISNTRSSLMWSLLDIVKIKQPDYIILENVQTITSKRFKKDLDEYISKLKMIYDIKTVIIRSDRVGSPQARIRWFLIGINKNKIDLDKIDLDKIEYQKPNKLIDLITISDTDDIINSHEIISIINDEIRVRQATKKGYDIANIGDVIDLTYPKSKTRRGRVQRQKSHTLTHTINPLFIVLDKNKYRRLTAVDYCLIQGRNKAYYNTLKELGLSDTVIKKKMGNAIDLNVFKNVLKTVFY